MKPMTLSDLHVASTGQIVRVAGQSATKTDDLRGRAELFSVSSRKWEMTVAHSRWENGDQDVKLYYRGTAPQRFDRLRSTCRLGLIPIRRSEFCVELMQARMGENDHPRLRKAGLNELSRPAGCDVRAVLSEMGAEVGIREALIGDTTRHRSRLCARFPRHDIEVAVVAYVLTRIAPINCQIRI